jgi:acyl-coenzyme A synthetase/AMP-(fatty) acid ligase
MVPRRITTMDALPKNANGKIDRVALLTLASSPP